MFKRFTRATAAGADQRLRAAIERAVTAARKLEIDGGRPVVVLLSEDGSTDFETGERYVSWGDTACELQRIWESDGARLPFQLAGVLNLGDAASTELELAVWRPDQLQEAFTAAGITALGVGEASALLTAHLGARANEQRRNVRTAMIRDVRDRVITLTAGTREVVDVLTSTDTTLEVTSFGRDRVVFAGGRLTPTVRGRQLLLHLAPQTKTVKAESVFLAGQPVTATADSDGSVTLTIGDRRVVVPAAKSAAVLAAVGAATTIAQQ